MHLRNSRLFSLQNERASLLPRIEKPASGSFLSPMGNGDVEKTKDGNGWRISRLIIDLLGYNIRNRSNIVNSLAKQIYINAFGIELFSNYRVQYYCCNTEREKIENVSEIRSEIFPDELPI